MNEKTGTAPTPESKQNVCRVCRKPIPSGCVLCDTCPSSLLPSHPESKQEWCVTTAKRAFVNARAEQLDAEIVSESKPTSEGAPAAYPFDEVVDLGEAVQFEMDGNKVCAHRLPFTNMMEMLVGFGDTPMQALVELIKLEQSVDAASLRSRLSAVEKERDEARQNYGELCDIVQDAVREASTCDDVKLDQPLAWIIAEIQFHREAAESALATEREKEESELNKAVRRWVEAKRQQELREDTRGELAAEVRRQEQDVEIAIFNELSAAQEEKQ